MLNEISEAIISVTVMTLTYFVELIPTTGTREDLPGYTTRPSWARLGNISLNIPAACCRVVHSLAKAFAGLYFGWKIKIPSIGFEI